MEYLDLDLVVERSGDGYVARVFNSPGGQASASFTLPFSDLELENFLLRVGRSRRTVRRAESPEMAAAKVFGGRLFDAVFAGDVRGCLRSSLDEARRQNAGLRVRLHLTKAPEIADLPWEFLYNSGMNRFLSLSVDTPVVRFLELPERIRPLALKPPLHVLMMISSPSDYHQLDVHRESANMAAALAELESKGLVQVERLEDATLPELQRRLRQGQFHIFHFIGHGGFDEAADDGILVLEDPEGRGRRVSAQFLGTLLHDHRPLRLAVLNACEGARASRGDPFGGTAQSLVQQGIPAVIGMQFEVTDEAAICFTREFYAALAGGYPVDAALAEARKAIFAEVSEIEWGTPVLYMRSPDGRIFDVEQVSETDRTQLHVGSLLAAAAAAEAAGDLTTAVEKVRAALAADPSHQEASARLPALGRAREVSDLYAAGRAAYEEGRWRESVDRLRHAVILDRGYKDVESLLRLAEDAQSRAAADAERQTRASALEKEAAAAAAAERWDDAVQAWQQLAALDPGNDQVRARLAEARQQQHLSRQYALGRAHFEQRHWREALVAFQQIQQATNGYKDVALLVTGIERELSRVPTGQTGATRSAAPAAAQAVPPPSPPPSVQAGTAPRQAAAVPRPPIAPSAPPARSSRLRWIIIGSAIGAAVVIGVVVVALMEMESMVKEAFDSGLIEQNQLSFQRDTPTPAPDPTGREGMGESASGRGGSPQEAAVSSSASARAELEAFMKRASNAEIAAYRTLNTDPLMEVYSGQLLAAFVTDIATVAATGVAAVRTLHAQEVNDVRVSPDGQTAQVTVTERWSTDFVFPLNGQCLQHIHEQDLTRTLHLQRAGTGWMAYAVQQPAGTPQLAPCH